MKIAFCADCHVGNHGVLGGELSCSLNRRCWDVLKALSTAVEMAKQANCSHLVVVGDLFDTLRPYPQMIANAQDILRKISTIVLVGNHEHASTQPGDNAVAPLRPIARIVETPGVVDIGDVSLLCLPCIPHHAAKWFESEVEKLANIVKSRNHTNSTCILCFHLGVEDAHTPKFLHGTKDSIPAATVISACEKHQISAAFSGNWHNQRVWNNTVFQLGALAPTGFDDPGIVGYGGLGIFDSSDGSVELLEVPGPRFIPLRTGDSVAPVRTASAAGNAVYARWTCNRNDLAAVRKEADELREQGLIKDYAVTIDKAAQRAVAQKAAAQVREAQSLQQAIAASVKKECLPAALEPEVAKRVENYLAH